MMDNSKEGLMFQHKKPSLSSSFDPISEKQEEMSNSSKAGNNQNNIISNKDSKDYIEKKVLDDTDFIKHSQTQKNKSSWVMNSLRNNYLQNNEDNKLENEKEKNINISLKRKISKKRIIKRNSMQEGRMLISNITLSQLNSSELKEKYVKKGSSGKQAHFLINSNLMQNSKSLYNKENSFTRNLSKTKSISNAVFEMKYINQTKNRKTTLHKGKLDFNDKAETKILDQIKNSDLYEKSESLLLKLKISYGILGLFSLLCIILNISDTMIYNTKSLEYLQKENNETYFNYEGNLEKYYFINKRKISKKENNIRLFDGIFSFICVLNLIAIYQIRNRRNDYRKKSSKKERFKRMLDQYYTKQKKKNIGRSKLKKLEEEKIKNEKIKVITLDPDNKELKDEKSTIAERNSTIINCIINIIFYPPKINKAFIGKTENIIYIYPLNALFLMISLFKITNIYKAVFYLSPINNSFNKAICKSNLIMLDSKFMFKYCLNKFPLSFLLLNLIIIFISICIILSGIEFFSVDIKDKFWNNSIENKAENFFKVSGAFFFFIIRNIYEYHTIKSILGKLILYMGGIFGMLVISYFIFYVNNLVEFTPEEHDAFSKLTKLLNPINKEHKASNLIKALILFKKILKDNQNTERDYRLKMEDFKKPSNNQRKPIFPKENNFQFAFNTNITANNLLNYENEEKKKFIKFIGNIFLLKAKFILEIKDFDDNLKIARNSSLSFSDVLKTIGNKMDGNITQLNNKIEVLIQNDQKFLNFIKFTTNTMKSIKTINNYHNSLLQYLVEVHNEYVKQMIEIRKEAEMNSPLIYQNSPKRMKSNIFGNLHFKNKVQSKIVYDLHRKKKLKKDMYDFSSAKLTIKKQRSSLIHSKYLQNNLLEEKIRQNRSKQNTTKTNKSRYRNKEGKDGKRTKSLDDWKFISKGLKHRASKGRNSVRNIGRSNSVVNRNKVNSK